MMAELAVDLRPGRAAIGGATWLVVTALAMVAVIVSPVVTAMLFVPAAIGLALVRRWRDRARFVLWPLACGLVAPVAFYYLSWAGHLIPGS